MAFINKLDNESTSSTNETDYIIGLANSSFVLIIQLSSISLTILLVIIYTAIILINPVFRKNKLNWFTINVCITSAFFSIIILGINLQQLLNKYSGLSCRSLFYLIDMSACQLMYSHCVFAISRYLAIVYAHKHLFHSNICLWSFIILGWIVSFLIALPHLFFDAPICFVSTQVGILPYYTLITTLFLPIIIVTIFNIWTLVFVRNSTRRIHGTGIAGQVSHKRDVFLVKLTIGTLIAFVVGWTPSFTIQLFNQTANVSHTLNGFFEILSSFAVLYDVLLLILTNQPVRTLLKQFIMKIFKC